MLYIEHVVNTATVTQLAMPGTKIAESLRRGQIVQAAYELALHGGLRAITIRDVAARAGMSTGLVLFHFGTKDRVVLALLDFVLANTTTLSVGPEIVRIRDAHARFVALLRQEMRRMSTEPGRNRIFFEFWSEGMWNRAIRARMQRDLDQYRAAFKPIAVGVIDADPRRFAGVDSASLAALAVSFIKGCAVQSMVEPNLDIAGYLRSAETLLGPRAAAPRRARRRAKAGL